MMNLVLSNETHQAVMRHRLIYADDDVVQVTTTSYSPIDVAGGTDIAYPRHRAERDLGEPR